jgi:2-polyprenyl-6-methoxyphenol hydroxylase-like FAD-dependent oxidoreductase
LYLAGDAAHIVTPAGGKGMNLALQDAAELVEGVNRFVHHGDRDRLDAYSTTRLPRIWRLMNDEVFTRAFARTYVGLDPMVAPPDHA